MRLDQFGPVARVFGTPNNYQRSKVEVIRSSCIEYSSVNLDVHSSTVISIPSYNAIGHQY